LLTHQRKAPANSFGCGNKKTRRLANEFGGRRGEVNSGLMALAGG
jgi:hypothetical protein